MKPKTIVTIVFFVLILNVFINVFIIKKSSGLETRYFYVDNAFYPYRDGSPEHPLASIQEAIDKAKDGDVIYVFGGIYTENLVINKKLKLWGSVERGDTIINSRFDVRYFVTITADKVEFQNFTISDSRGVLTSPIGALLCIKASNVVVQSNHINCSSAYGIFVDPLSNGNFISGNVINDTKHGIVVSSSFNNDIVDNTIFDCSDSAIEMISCNNNRIYKNLLYSNNIGIKIKDSINTNISENIITISNVYGIFLDNDKNDLVYKNNISDNQGYGMFLNLFNGEVFENILDNNTRGITLSGASCKVYSNVITNSTGSGVYTTTSSYSHIIYLNQFIGNSKNAQENGKNFWYDSLLEKGNYWSDYDGVDFLPDGKGDGIGDTFYTKNGVLDKYPLGIFDKPPDKPSNPNPADLQENVGLEITLQVTVFDPDGDELTVYFYRADTNVLIKPDAVVKKVPSGGKASFTFVQGFDTTFAWYVIVSDGKLENKSETWIFTTRSAPPNNIPPVVKPGGPYTGVVDLPVDFDGSKSYDPDGEIIFYRWNFGDGTSEILSSSPSHVYLTPGVYEIILTIVDDNRACATNTTTVTIYGSSYNKKPVADPGGPYNGVVSEIVVFDGSNSFDEDGTIKNFSWVFPDGTTKFGQIVTYTFTSTGSYIVTLTVTDNFNEKNSSFAQVFIKSSAENESPGFELVLTFFVIFMFLLLKKKKR
ncbi:MAG: PKD domain-containing protein [Thermoplasmatota archaeon]